MVTIVEVRELERQADLAFIDWRTNNGSYGLADEDLFERFIKLERAAVTAAIALNETEEPIPW